jgi:hypothetical protein
MASQVLKANRVKIQMLSKVRFLLKEQRLVLVMDLNEIIGSGVLRSASDKLVRMSKVRVVIQYGEYNFMPAYIVTAFPIP